MRVYISGKITDVPVRRYLLRFARAEQMLRAEGHEVINPAAIGLNLPMSFTHRDYMDVDIMLLDKCDAIFMLNNWEDSAGAQQEHEYAEQKGLDIIYENEQIQSEEDRC